MKLRRTKKEGSAKLGVLAATNNAELLSMLWNMSGVDVLEARSTLAINAHLPHTSLVIIDMDDVVNAGNLGRQGLAEIIASQHVPRVTSRQFLDNTPAVLQEAQAFAGDVKSLPPRVVTFASYSGGVGKTTMAIALAEYVAQQTHLPVALLELPHATSGLIPVLLSREGAHHNSTATVALANLPSLYAVGTQGETAQQVGGITIVPINQSTFPLVSPEIIDKVITQVASAHVLTIVDAVLPHTLWSVVAKCTDRFFVPADWHRQDTIDAAKAAYEMITSTNENANEHETQTRYCSYVLNKANKMTKLLASTGEGDEQIVIPDFKNVAAPQHVAAMAKALLSSIWPRIQV